MVSTLLISLHLPPRWSFDYQSRRGDQRGASLVEYSLLLALIAGVCFAALVFFGNSLSDSFSSSGSKFVNP